LECGKNVIFCSTLRQLEKATARKSCVAFWSGACDPKTGESVVTLGFF
jgi:hypothetical protein